MGVLRKSKASIDVDGTPLPPPPPPPPDYSEKVSSSKRAAKKHKDLAKQEEVLEKNLQESEDKAMKQDAKVSLAEYEPKKRHKWLWFGRKEDKVAKRGKKREIKKQREMLLEKLSSIRDIEKKRRQSLTIARKSKEDRQWLMEDRKKELAKMQSIHERSNEEDVERQERLARLREREKQIYNMRKQMLDEKRKREKLRKNAQPAKEETRDILVGQRELEKKQRRKIKKTDSSGTAISLQISEDDKLQKEKDELLDELEKSLSSVKKKRKGGFLGLFRKKAEEPIAEGDVGDLRGEESLQGIQAIGKSLKSKKRGAKAAPAGKSATKEDILRELNKSKSKRKKEIRQMPPIPEPPLPPAEAEENKDRNKEVMVGKSEERLTGGKKPLNELDESKEQLLNDLMKGAMEDGKDVPETIHYAGDNSVKERPLEAKKRHGMTKSSKRIKKDKARVVSDISERRRKSEEILERIKTQSKIKKKTEPMPSAIVQDEPDSIPALEKSKVKKSRKKKPKPASLPEKATEELYGLPGIEEPAGKALLFGKSEVESITPETVETSDEIVAEHQEQAVTSAEETRPMPEPPAPETSDLGKENEELIAQIESSLPKAESRKGGLFSFFRKKELPSVSKAEVTENEPSVSPAAAKETESLDQPKLNEPKRPMPMPPVPEYIEENEEKSFGPVPDMEFVEEPDEERQDLDNKVGEEDLDVDGRLAKIMRMIDSEKATEEERHKHEKAVEMRLAEREKQVLEEEGSFLPRLLEGGDSILTTMAERRAIRSQAAQVAKEIREEKGLIELDDVRSEMEIHEAIKTIKEDKLVFKPKDLILEKEHLIDEKSVYGDVEYILDRIADAREEMLKLNIKKVRKIYVEVMAIYQKLTAEEQRRVYPEIADLYEDRRRVETLVAK